MKQTEWAREEIASALSPFTTKWKLDILFLWGLRKTVTLANIINTWLISRYERQFIIFWVGGESWNKAYNNKDMDIDSFLGFRLFAKAIKRG